MDKKSPKTREYISERAKLLGAIRLPNNAFKSNAGTETITDIIFLQKRPVITAEHDDWCYIDYNSDGIAVNSYFLNHPEMICGEMTMRSGRYGDELDVKPFNALTLEMALNNAIRHLPKNIEWKSDIPNTTIEKGEYTLYFYDADGAKYTGGTIKVNPAEVTIWEGSFNNGEWAGNQDLAWGGYDWSKVKVGQVLTFYCTANDPASGWCCVDVRQGTEWKNLDGDHQLNGNGSTTVLTYTISAAALDQLVNNNGLVFTGTGMTITKVTLK